jgi:signal transduction histidine kinase
MRQAETIFDEDLRLREQARPFLSGRGYRRLYRTVVIATATVALVPLLVMTFLAYRQYERALSTERTQGITRLLTNNKRSLEFFLAERRSALQYIIRDRTFAELNDPRVLSRVMRNMNDSFHLGAFVDLGLIDSEGIQTCYVGPYELQGLNYQEQDWFQHVVRGGVYMSDAFLGFRHSPHFTLATRHERGDDDYYVLRATFDAQMLAVQMHTAGLEPGDDIFLVNVEGILQTPSRMFGPPLQAIPLSVPSFRTEAQLIEDVDDQGRPVLVGFADIADSPFILVFARSLPGGFIAGPLAELLIFLGVSAALILAVIIWGSRQFVRNIRDANLRRAALMHQVEYSNKLASLGRLAAGVAHEINNPLAIINEKAGLLEDLVKPQPDFPSREKFLKTVESVLNSVVRCKNVTHRLLGFAKHMDVQSELIDVPGLLKEVAGFLEREAEHRSITINIESAGEVPSIESDRGQLQQVFLNLLNNAVGAVEDGGRIDVSIERRDLEVLAVSVADDGVGIPAENLERIFEPFFTTKEGSGTGLGLSITYGIIQKLGGEISVESEVGKGTCVTVLLPIRRKD